ncbi:MAG: hypothetical protein M3Y42_17175 [Actinomycetota bacterium]|nr:hypothetical protein [Actinomycetota bacterium]
MSRFGYKTASTAAVLIPVALLAAGCSSGKSSTGAGGYGVAGAATNTTSSTVPTPTSTAAAAPASASQTGTATAGIAVTATEQEFSIALSVKTFTAGTYTFTVHNVGHFQHNLTIEGPGVDKIASPTIPGGSTGKVTVTFQKGSYELWCSVDSHKDKGMDLNIVVG